MPAWIYVLAVAAVLTVAWYGFARRWWHSLRYSWQQARHLADLTETEVIPGAEYGSMILEDDPNGPAITELLRRYESTPDGPGGVDWDILPAPHAVNWRERTRVELAPETLDLLAAPVDPGPGGEGSSSSPSPGPDQDVPGLSVTEAGYLPWQAGHQDAPGRECDPAPVAAAGEVGHYTQEHPPPPPDWLEAQRAEVYAWVRGMVPQVTGWSVGA